MPNYRKKLIEVNIPLQAINQESAKDASLTHGHPSTLHRYWARRPLAACRAVIFASMVDDPSACPDEFPTESEQNAERNRLHSLLRRLVIWQNSNDENLLAEARLEIARSIARNKNQEAPTTPEAVVKYIFDHCPAVYDPFCGGGSIPLEAQRLGLRARGTDLNPLPVLITKAMIELPPQFHNQPPVNPDAAPNSFSIPWKGTTGLASDIRYYGAWMREEAHKRLGHLYPKVQLTDGTTATVVAWLWARTIPCINPACRLHMPLMKTFQLSKKRGNEHWTRPIRNSNTISWHVQNHPEGVPQATVNRTGAYCFACGTAVKLPYVREQAKAGKMGEIMTAIVAEGHRRKLFFSPTDEHIQVAQCAEPAWRPRAKLPDGAANLRVQGYGITEWHQLFTDRQLTALTTFSDLLSEVRSQITQDGAATEAVKKSLLCNTQKGLLYRYADAVCTYLSLAIGRTAESGCRFAWWENSATFVAPTFTRQALQMSWGFAEANPFSTSTQNWIAQVEWIAKVIEKLPGGKEGPSVYYKEGSSLPPPVTRGEVYQADAATTMHAADSPVIVTDPPYYDNIGYADLSEFFYVWLRPLLRDTYTELFAGMMPPKMEEITASPRFENPTQHFENLLGKAFLQMRRYCSTEYPTSIFYAFKQQEKKHDGSTSTGWEMMLMAIVNAGFRIVGTWPLRTERTTGVKVGINALAFSIVLVCRPRPADAPTITRNDFIESLKKEMPHALDRLTRIANIRPVDLAQAAIGPGMEIYSRYRAVTRMSGEHVSIREALMHINKEIAAYHEKETGELDAESQFCLTWLQQHGYMAGDFGDAEGLSKAKDVDIGALHDKVLIAERGKVRLLRREEYASRKNSDAMIAWEGCQRMVWHLSGIEGSRGISGCAAVARAMRDYESAKRLAGVLYAYYEGRGDAESASDYNNLVTEWQYISQSMGSPELTGFA